MTAKARLKAIEKALGVNEQLFLTLCSEWGKEAQTANDFFTAHPEVKEIKNLIILTVRGSMQVDKPWVPYLWRQGGERLREFPDD